MTLVDHSIVGFYREKDKKATIVPLFPRFEVLRATQDDQYPPYLRPGLFPALVSYNWTSLRSRNSPGGWLSGGYHRGGPKPQEPGLVRLEEVAWADNLRVRGPACVWEFPYNQKATRV